MGKQDLKPKRRSIGDIKDKPNGALPSDPTKSGSIFSLFNCSMFLLVAGVGVLFAAVVMKAVELKTQNQFLEETIEDANVKIGELNDEGEKSSEVISAAKIELERFKNVEKKSKQIIEAANKQIEELKTNKENQNERIQDLQTDGDELSEKLYEIIGENKENIREVNKRSEQITDLESDITTLKKEKKYLEKQGQDLQIEVETTVSKLIEATDANTDLNIVFEEKKEQMNQLEKNFETTSTALADHQAANKIATDNLHTIVNQLKVDITQKDQEIKANLNAANNLNLSLDQMKMAVVKKNEDIASLEAEANVQVNNKEKMASELNNLKIEMATKIELVENEFKSCDEAAKSLTNKLADEEGKTTSLKKEKENLEIKLKEDQLKITAEMQARYEALETEKDAKIGILENSNRNLVEGIKKEKSDKNTLFDEKTQLGRTLEDLKLEMSQVDNSLKVAQADVGNCIVERTAERNKVGELQDTLVKEKKGNEDQKEENMRKSSELENTRASHNQLEESTRILTVEKEALAQEVNALKSKLETCK